MSGKHIIVAPLAEVKAALSEVCSAPAAGAASRGERKVFACGLLGPGMAHPELPLTAKRRLCLNLHDVAEAREGFVSPAPEHVRALLEFAVRWREEDGAGALLLYCWMGVSRSPAAAYVVQCALNPYVDELALALRLRRLAPFATPNARLVALADELLGRNGRMVAAIAAIGRGAETVRGWRFVWPLADDGSAPARAITGRGSAERDEGRSEDQ